MGEEAYHRRISDFIHDFINDQVLPHHKHDNIRAIVIFGEASMAAVGLLRGIAREAVGHEDVELIMDIESSEVVAHGAATWARMASRSEPPGKHPEMDEEYWARATADAQRRGHNEL